MSTAMQQALDVIDAEFNNPKRNEHKHALIQGCRVQSLVEGGRYSYPEACRLMKISYPEVQAAFDWLNKENAELNAKFTPYKFYIFTVNVEMVEWMREQHAAQPSATVIGLMTAINTAADLQQQIGG